MKRTTAIAVLVILLQGFAAWQTLATAQGFNVRHDLYGWQQPRTAYSIEQNSVGEFIAFANGPWLDTATMLTYSSVCGLERFSPLGGFVSEDTVFLNLQASYVGWSNCSTTLPDGRIVVSGGVTDGPDTNKTAIYWFSPSGVLLNITQIIPNSQSWITYQHKNTPDGGFILTGVTDATGYQDIFLLKTDSLGNVQWWQTYGHPTRADYATSIDLAPDGGYYIGGSYPQTVSKNIQWLLHTDSLGVLQWQVFPGGLQDVDYVYGEYVLSTMDNHIV